MTTLPLAEARAQLSRLVDDAVSTHERFEITRNGRRVAMLLAADDYDSLRETLAVLSDNELIADLREGEAALAAGDHVDEHELTEMMGSAGRHRA
jgi:prevent-host-death family protein